MSDLITSSNNQVIQVISFTILNDSTFEKRYSREGRRWREAMQTIKYQKGWVRTLYGHDMSSFHKVDLYVGASRTFSGSLALLHKYLILSLAP